MRKLCGRWRDQMGSSYRLDLDKGGVMEVRTTRPRGKTMTTRGLIRIQWQGETGRVVWGRPGARIFYTLGNCDDESLTWESTCSKPFHWDRVGGWHDDDEEEPEAEEEYEEE